MTYFTGTGSADTLTGTPGADVIEGGDGNDLLTGDGGADQLLAGAGADTVAGGLGDVRLDGGVGDDLGRLDFSGAAQGMRFAVTDNLTKVQTVAGVQVVGFERVDFTGGAGADWLTGGGENDTLSGAGGNDLLKGGAGGDLLLGGEGRDILDGGAGNDTLDGGDDIDQVTGGDGDDLVFGETGDAQLDGGGGRDLAVLDFSALSGGVTFSVAANQAGWTHFDQASVRGFEQVDLLLGQGADDLTGGPLADTLNGAAGDDSLKGLGGDDRLLGGDGADTLEGGGGDDRLEGGGGFDLARYAGARSDYQVTVQPDGAVRIVDLHAERDGADAVKGVEQFAFSDRSISLSELVTGEPNHAPDAVDDAVAVRADTPLVIDVLANDHDPDLGDVIHVVSVDAAEISGNLSWSPANGGSVFYGSGVAGRALAAGETLVEHFGYTVGDLYGHTAAATATITLSGVNDAPTAQDDHLTASDHGPASVEVLVNDFDVDHGDSLTLVSAGSGLHGSAAVRDGLVVYTPNPQAQGLQEGQTLTDSFAYTVKDQSGAVSTATVQVLIQGHNDAPVAMDDFATVEAGANRTLTGLLLNDSDPDNGDVLKIGALPAYSAQGVTLSLDSDGNVVYMPGQVFAGLPAGDQAEDSFIYTVIDSHGLQSQATAHLTVSGAALPEDSLIIERYLVQDESTENLFDVVVAQARAALGEDATLVSVDTTGMQGSASLTDTSLIFTADGAEIEGLWGDNLTRTSLDYTVRTATGAVHLGRIEFTVNGYNDAPIAVVDALQIGAGVSTDNLWDLLLANDDDIDLGQALQIEAVDSTGSAGRITVDLVHHQLAYHADTASLLALNPGETLHDHFTYSIGDGVGGHATGEVDVVVSGSMEGWVVG